MIETKKKGMFWTWGLKMYQFRWIVVVFWSILFIISAFFAQKLPERLKDSGLTPKGSESDIGFSLMQTKLGAAPSMMNIVYTSKQLDLTAQQQVNVILKSLSPLKKLPYVKSIQINKTPRTMKEKGVQSVIVEFNLKNSEALNRFPEIRRLVPRPVGMKTFVNGEIATLYDIQLATKQDLGHAETIGLPIALTVLLVIFGTVWAAIIPLIIGSMSVSLTLGLTYYITNHYSVSNFLPNIVMMLGLAIGVDYALFIVSRFQEELKRYDSVAEAVAMTTQTAGKSIYFSGIAVFIGLLGMLFIKLPIIYSLCLGGVLVVCSAVTLSSTLLPALLGIFGRHINSLKVFPSMQRRMEKSDLWEQIANSVMKRPAFLSIIISILLITLMLPIARMKLGVPTAEVLPPSFESRIGTEIVKNNYDRKRSNPIQILVKTNDDVFKVATIREIQSYEERIRKITGVMEVRSFIDLLKQSTPEKTAAILKFRNTQQQMKTVAKGNYTLLTIVPRSNPESVGAARLVHRLSEMRGTNLTSYVTGQTALRVDMLNRIYSGLPFLMLFIMTVTYIVLFIAFKSILIPIKAVAMNILSLGASLGIVVIVFQYGWLAHTLEITSIGYVSIIMPVTIFCIVFGISMDYEVFLISRIKEEYDLSGDNVKSTAAGLQKTGSLISSAALILMVVVGSFIFTNLEITKALGVGLFCAIFIDATFIRIIVVPALMKLMGPANWWAPKWIGEK